MLCINIHSRDLDSQAQVSTMGNADNAKGTLGGHRAVEGYPGTREVPS